jgi:hypothetical protein
MASLGLGKSVVFHSRSSVWTRFPPVFLRFYLNHSARRPGPCLARRRASIDDRLEDRGRAHVEEASAGRPKLSKFAKAGKRPQQMQGRRPASGELDVGVRERVW